MTERLSDAERARRYRARRRGGPPRTVSDDAYARAKRKINRGAKIADLDPAEREALRDYNRRKAAERRTRR